MSTADQFAAAGVTPRTDNDPTHVDRYRIVGRLGAGGMGTVYAAVDDHGTPLALKVVHREYATDTEFRARFSREVNLVRRVSGTCVPAFRDADTEGDRPWLGIEYVPGLTLNAHVNQHGPLTGDMLLGLAAGTAEALQTVHATGIVHRDLKPGNIILALSGPKVLDFGIARAVEESAITRTGGLFGTPGWLAPEQYQGADPDPPSDMFAWGGLVAYAATGREPFGTGAPNALAYRVRQAEPDLDGVPGELCPLVATALAKDPAARPSAAEALRRVEQLWGGARASETGAVQDPAAAVTTLLRAEWVGMDTVPPKPPRGRRRTLLVAGAGVTALVIVGGGVFAAPAAIDTLGGENGNDESGQGGGNNGGDGTGDGNDGGGETEGGGGEAQEEVDDPPDAAVDQVDGPTEESATAQVGTAQGNVGLFTASVSGGIAATEIFVYGPEHAGDGIQFTVNGQSQGVRDHAPEFTQEAFSVFANGRELTPDEGFRHVPPEPSEHDLEEQFTYTLSVPEAPESGLLAFQAPVTDGGELPPVGICYDAASGIFTTEYQECT